MSRLIFLLQLEAAVECFFHCTPVSRAWSVVWPSALAAKEGVIHRAFCLFSDTWIIFLSLQRLFRSSMTATFCILFVHTTRHRRDFCCLECPASFPTFLPRLFCLHVECHASVFTLAAFAARVLPDARAAGRALLDVLFSRSSFRFWTERCCRTTNQIWEFQLARSRLYRRRFSKANTHFSQFLEIYKILHTFAPLQT